jgi:hypothetical protein
MVESHQFISVDSRQEMHGTIQEATGIRPPIGPENWDCSLSCKELNQGFYFSRDLLRSGGDWLCDPSGFKCALK